MKLIKTPLEFVKAKKGQEIILLGTWCLNKDLDFIDEKYKSKILPYHWKNREVYNKDYIYLGNLYEKKLAFMSGVLNKIHNTQKDINYWRVIVGPWLRFCLDAVYDRYESIKLAKESEKITDFSLFTYNLNDLCPENFNDFWEDFTSDYWNEIIFSECIKHQNISYNIYKESYISPLRVNKIYSSNFSAHIKKLLFKLSLMISDSNQKVIFYKSYTNFYKIFKLNIKLNQVPKYWSFDECRHDSRPVNNLVRNYFKDDIPLDAFEMFFNNLFPYLIPKSYIEDYSELKEKLINQMPGKPKNIFTANAYQNDDYFKIWAAEQIEKNAALIVGQHGGQFGIAKHNQTIDHQLKIASKFISWGWTEKKRDNIFPLPSIQLSNSKTIKPYKRGKILSILNSPPRYFYCHQSLPVAEQGLLYIEDQLKFISNLNKDNFENLLIRLDSNNSKSRSWNIGGLLELKGYDSKIDKGNTNLSKLVKKSKICIATTNTTVYLETFSKNFPTIIFWNKDFTEISKDAQEYINLLHDAEILFYCPIEAAKKLNKVYDNIDEWWFSVKVQEARAIFCDRYALTSGDWLQKWSVFLKIHSSKDINYKP